jgi:hypothetical protein
MALPARGDQPAAVQPPLPTTVEAADKELSTLKSRLDALFVEASRDPHWREVEKYTGYSYDDFKANHLEVEAKDLVKIMEDEKATFQVREAAAKALNSQKARTFDPDLATEKSGGRTPRKEFARRKVAPLIKADDAVSRKLANDLLIQWFGRPSDPDILGFDPRTASRKQRNAAYTAWLKVLR